MSTRDTAIANALAWFDDEQGYFETLSKRVAVPTESQEASQLPELYRYLEDFIRPDFEDMGYDVTVYDNPFEGQGPVLLATRIEDPALPTILGYGHGDAVRGQADRWTKGEGPWVLSRDGDHVYGRGTADNKAQHTTHMGALKAVIETRGRLGFNSKFMVETGEENGSKGLSELVAAHKDAFMADAYFASDGPRVNIAKPNLTLGNRGCLNFDLLIEAREGGHHSGNWGGLLSNPGVVLSHAIASITDSKGKILVDGWTPGPISNSVREALSGVERDGGADAPTIDQDWGEPGLTSAEKVYAWNSFEVLSFVTGNPNNPVNAIPPRARANCQLRFVVGTDLDKVEENLRKHLDKHGFEQVIITKPPEGNDAVFHAARTPPDHPWAQWMRSAVERTTGEVPVMIPNSGGSICNDVFQDVLGIPFVWMPLSYTGCSQHAPNEHILWSLTREGMSLVSGVYWDLGDEATAWKP